MRESEILGYEVEIVGGFSPRKLVKKATAPQRFIAKKAAKPFTRKSSLPTVKAQMRNMSDDQKRALIIAKIRNPKIRAKLLAKLAAKNAAPTNAPASAPPGGGGGGAAPVPSAPPPAQDDTEDEQYAETDESESDDGEETETDENEGDDMSGDTVVMGLSIRKMAKGAAKIAKKTGGAVTPENIMKGAAVANAVRSGDPKAIMALKNLNKKAKAGDPNAKKAVAVVKAGDKLAQASTVPMKKGKRSSYKAGLALSAFQNERKYGPKR